MPDKPINQPMTGRAYRDLILKVSKRVVKWPAWKRGEATERREFGSSVCDQHDNCEGHSHAR